jgi:hypothetical protein
MIRANTEAIVQKVGALVASLVAVFCLVAEPAHASIAADFNGDGVLDAVVLPRPPETNIVIHLSGTAPQVLRLSGRIISIVAVDVDHDGNLDLSALSDRRGLLVWLNKAGHGRFAALKKHRALRGVGFSRGSRATATQQGNEAPLTSGDRGASPDADAPRAGPVFDAPPGDYTASFLPSTFSPSLGKATAPRGPPSLTVDLPHN